MGRAAWLAFAICAAGVLTACSGGSGTQPSATGGDSSTKAGKAPLCAQGTMLPFDYKKAASVKDADGRPIGPDGAKSLVGELGDSDSVCGLDVSPDTQKVIDDAHALVQQGKKTDALSLIDAETTRVIALPSVGSLRYGTRGMAMAATGEADQKVRDLLGLGGAAQDAGDDGARQLAEAQAIYGPILEERLKSADWQEAVKIAAEAEKLGLDDLQKRAQDKVKSEVGKMADDARKNFDVCLSTDAQMKKRVTLLALAQMTLDDGAAAIGTITGVHTNNLPPECARWNIKLTYFFQLNTGHGGGNGWTFSATWSGTFQVGKTGKVDGAGVGLWSDSDTFCLVGDALQDKPSSGGVKVTIGGELKDETFHLIPNHAATVTEGCTNEPSVPGGVEDFFGIGIDIFAKKAVRMARLSSPRKTVL